MEIISVLTMVFFRKSNFEESGQKIVVTRERLASSEPFSLLQANAFSAIKDKDRKLNLTLDGQ